MPGSPQKPDGGMRAIDTNLVVRYLTGDDPEQEERIRALIGHEPVFVPRTVLLEAEWVLRGVYEFSPKQIIPAIRALAGLPGVSVEDAALVATAMDWTDAGMDFADALHLAAAAGCEGFLTFDRRFARTATPLAGIPISAP